MDRIRIQISIEDPNWNPTLKKKTDSNQVFEYWWISKDNLDFLKFGSKIFGCTILKLFIYKNIIQR